MSDQDEDLGWPYELRRRNRYATGTRWKPYCKNELTLAQIEITGHAVTMRVREKVMFRDEDEYQFRLRRMYRTRLLRTHRLRRRRMYQCRPPAPG